MNIYKQRSPRSGFVLFAIVNTLLVMTNDKRYESELPYQRPDLIEVMEIEIDLITSTNVRTSFDKSIRECLDC